MAREQAIFHEVNSCSSNLTYHLLKVGFVANPKIFILTKTVHNSTSITTTKVLACRVKKVNMEKARNLA